MSRIEFVVTGSKGDQYKVAFERNGSTVHAFCTCQAGQNGSYCKHRIWIMDGEVGALASRNPEDLAAVKKMMAGSGLEQKYNRYLDAEANHKKAKLLLDQARIELSKAMHR